MSLPLEGVKGIHVVPLVRRCGQASVEPSHGKPQLVEITPLGPVHSSKVSKPTGKKRLEARRPGSKRLSNLSQETHPGGVLLFSDPNIAEPAPPSAGITRRTKRLEVPDPSKAKELSNITSTEPQNIKTRLRPRRNGAGIQKPPTSAKPQGISKKPSRKPRWSRTRGKARE